MKSRIFILLIICSSILHSQESCYECHGFADFVTETEDGKERSLYVNAEQYAQSAHGFFSCTDCHADAVGDPHDEDLAPVNCGMCHDDVQMHYLSGTHGKSLNTGHQNATCASCHTSHYILSEHDENSTTHPFNLPSTCGQCHYNSDMDSTSHPIMHFLKGAHGKALADGNDFAATCNDCHDSHKALGRGDSQSRVFGFNIAATCGRCHEDIYNEYASSIHGQSLANGAFIAPTCINCHNSHNIEQAADPTSPTNRLRSAEVLCDPCHSSELLNERFGINMNVVTSYMDSYHGLASRGGSDVAANCNDCHGIHNIRSKYDTLATVHVNNVTETCQSCHEDATEKFSQSYSHTDMQRTEDRLAAIVRSIYIWLIIIIIGGMILHNFIIWLYSVRQKAASHDQTDTVERFSRPAVLQHIALIVSFSILVVTGFALKSPEAAWVNILNAIGLDEMSRGIIHRIAAVLLILTSIVHILYVLLDRRFKDEPRNMAPRLQDAKEAIHNIAFYLGLSKSKPTFHKYSYIEKAEYWAMVWGTLVMILTGFVLWFPTAATAYLPAWIIKVSEVIHYYEAILATLSILFYHMFFAIFHPEDYPLNLTGFTGKMPKEEVKQRFPRWHKDLENDDPSN